jgi:type III secretion system FlhB-like substrate exporter
MMTRKAVTKLYADAVKDSAKVHRSYTSQIEEEIVKKAKFFADPVLQNSELVHSLFREKKEVQTKKSSALANVIELFVESELSAQESNK